MVFSHDDKYLMKFLKVGDYAAFEAIFNKYHEKYLKFIIGMVKDTDVAEDITQNIFLKLWINRNNINENLSLPAYLYVMSKYEIYNHFRALRNHKTACFSEILTSSDTMFTLASNCTPFDELTFSELNAKVMELIDRMPPKRRVIFKMNRFDRKTAFDIASEMGISVRTVEKHIELALKYLKVRMGRV